jgi:hypothetical protein
MNSNKQQQHHALEAMFLLQAVWLEPIPELNVFVFGVIAVFNASM